MSGTELDPQNSLQEDCHLNSCKEKVSPGFTSQNKRSANHTVVVFSKNDQKKLLHIYPEEYKHK